MSLSSKSQIRKIEGMTPKAQEAYFATGRVSVGRYSTIEKTKDGKKVSKTYYVAKIRGVVVGGGDDPWKYDTQEAALKFGKEVLDQWKSDFLKAN